MRAHFVSTGLFLALAVAVQAQRPAPDVLPGSGGKITIVPISHGSLEIQYGSHVILIDPSRFTPGSPAPPADSQAVTPDQLSRYHGLRPPTLILVTDIHGDHLDTGAIGALKMSTTTVVVPAAASAQVPGALTMANDEAKTIAGVSIEAVPMYNVRPDPQSGQTFHTKGRGNGYIVTLGGKRLYVAGDTGCTPEMKALKNIDVAFLPMNLPYTMTPAEAAGCAKAFMPRIVYPYHYFGSDLKAFETALKGTAIEVRLRDWYVPVVRTQ